MELTLLPLRRTQYSDTRAILTAFSRERGRVALSVAAGAGRGGNRMRALLLPGAAVVCQAEARAGRDVMTARAFAPLAGHPSFEGASAPQTLLAMVLTEVLDTMLRGSDQPDERLFDFAAGAFARLRQLPEGREANFHLVFLYRLAVLGGFEPDHASWREGALFDLRGGVFATSWPGHDDVVAGDAARMVNTLGRLTFDNMHLLRLSRRDRNDCLDAMLRYLAIHTGAERLATGLRSLAIARDIL